MNRFNGNFTVEETNLLSIYMTGSKEGLVVAMNATLPFMEGEMRDFAARTLEKVVRMTEAEFAGLAVYPADEV
ncbi:TPA: transposon-transfer assisting family protein [Clostridioides difficile]|nr:transposon-transfer assisting family protein [Clostridioides difficile]